MDLSRSFFGGKHGANPNGDGTRSQPRFGLNTVTLHKYYIQQTAKAIDTRIMNAKSAKILESSLCSL
jgi:hypothetical protein